tara:strand:+ start:283 stop:669 length:387 start_codon:yes stop_codon:yes gene_type:complete
MNNLEESSLAKLNTDSLINIILKLKNEYDIKINKMTEQRDNCIKASDYLNEHIRFMLNYKIIRPCGCGRPIKEWECTKFKDGVAIPITITNGYECAECDIDLCDDCACVKEYREPKNIICCPDCMGCY